MELFGASMLATIGYFFSLEANYIKNANKQQFPSESKTLHPPKHFDFIIVGAGTAGCLLASRLSEKFSVLLLEEGGPIPSLIQIPVFRPQSWTVSEINYIFKTSPQIAAFHKTLKVSQGKMMGGSFAHNVLIYNRGNTRDYDVWANVTQDESWKYKNVVKIYKKLEKYMGGFTSSQRGKKGPIPVITGHSFLGTYYTKAIKEVTGRDLYGDSNGPQKPGVSPLDFTETKNGRAVTTCSIFIDPIQNRRKLLTVVNYADVTRILFKGKTAIGVKFRKFGKRFQAFAKKEVILSAGVYGSPILLLLSGIGPRRSLQKAKIPIVKELPGVGKHLMDHPSVEFNVTLNNPGQIPTIYYNLTQKSIDRYLQGKFDSLLSIPVPGPQIFLVTKSAKQRGEVNWPDIQFIQTASKITPGAIPAISMFVTLGRPFGVGELKLNSKAYKRGIRKKERLIKIDFKLLEDERDLEALLDGMKQVWKLLNTSVFQAVGPRLVPDEFCAKKYALHTDDFWKCVIRKYITIASHTIGTCRMGFGVEDKNSVVDKHFRVHGLYKLRVIDASVFPSRTNANTNAPTMLIAELGAQKLLGKYNSK